MASRTFDPSKRRIQNARETGNVPLSREFMFSAAILAGSGGLFFIRESGTAAAESIFSEIFRAIEAPTITNATLAIENAASLAFIALVPLFILVMGAVTLSGIVHIGPLLAWRKLFGGDRAASATPPRASTKGIDTIALLIRTIVVSSIVALLLGSEVRGILGLVQRPPEAGLTAMLDLSMHLLLWTGIGLVCWSLVDLVWRRLAYQKSLMMTRAEWEDELRETGQNALIRKRQNQLQNEERRARP